MHDLTNQLALAEEIGGRQSIASVGIYTDLNQVAHPKCTVTFLHSGVYTERGQIGDRVYLTETKDRYARLVITGDPNDDPLDLLTEAIGILQDATVAL